MMSQGVRFSDILNRYLGNFNISLIYA
jgi:hypothetical protein